MGSRRRAVAVSSPFERVSVLRTEAEGFADTMQDLAVGFRRSAADLLDNPEDAALRVTYGRLADFCDAAHTALRGVAQAAAQAAPGVPA